MAKPKAPLETRFWLKVAKGQHQADCWFWKASIDVNGYGQFLIHKNQLDSKVTTMAKAHRIAWLLTRGEIPEGMYVCHRCDMPRCVNPDHLFLGSQTDNMRDCVAKNRHGFGRVGQPIYFNVERIKKIIAAYRDGMKVEQIGFEHGISPTHLLRVLKRHKIPLRTREDAHRKLTDTEVLQIRELYALGHVSQYALAERFGVTQSNIGYIIRGHSWPELPVNPTITAAQIRHGRKR